MMISKKPIFTGLGPNITARDTSKALAFLFFPWKWGKIQKGDAPNRIEEKIRKYFNTDAVVFDSGRSALQFSLQALGVVEGDEVLVQAYTCVVVINAIQWAGATPVFVDIGDDLNMNVKNLEKKITSRSKVILLQHTFGNPADVEAIIQLAKKYSLKTIEDCAHSLGATYKNKKLGTWADVGMLSFGSDKIISCVRGGAAITSDQEIAQNLRNFQTKLPSGSVIKTLQHLVQYPLFSFTKPLYNFGVGKWILALSKRFNILYKIIYPPEKRGEKLSFYPSQLPNALATILLHQFDALDSVNAHRKEIARIYDEELDKDIPRPVRTDERGVYLDYAISVPHPVPFLSEMKKEGIYIGSFWWGSVLVPKDIQIKKFKYQEGECPRAETLSSGVLLLPTNRHITIRDARRIAQLTNIFYA